MSINATELINEETIRQLVSSYVERGLSEHFVTNILTDEINKEIKRIINRQYRQTNANEVN